MRTGIAAALKRNIPITPVLVQGASMRPAPSRPDNHLKAPALRDGFGLRGVRWKSDVAERVRRRN